MKYTPHTGNDFEADALLPCPFCGQQAELLFIGNDYSKKRHVTIKCKCRIQLTNSGMRFNSEKLARITIAQWNTRQMEREQ
jgi:hypothetical protein